MHCTNCGAALSDGVTVCPACGEAQTPVEALSTVPAEPASEPAADTISETDGGERENPLIGWSDKLNDPMIAKAALRQQRSARMFGIIFGVIFPVGLTVAGFLIKSLPLKAAIITGLSLGVIMVLIAYFRLRSLDKPIWEGTVADKTAVERFDKKTPDKARTDYTIVFKGISGGKKKLRFKNDSSAYDYYNIGDKVRYYPVFGTYEKRDKSHDSIIFCNVCSCENPIENRKCKRCKSPLFK